SQDALDKAAKILLDDGCKRILEVGIGTGRIAKPLIQRNFDLVGIDFSRGMLAKAREKGINDLVMGEANSLPFDDKVFDAAIMAHVLHLLHSPAETFGKLTRVARKAIVIFIRKREAEAPSSSGDELLHIRRAFSEVAEEMGYPLASHRGDWRDRFKNEKEFLSTFPPDELVTIQDGLVVTTLGERVSHFEKAAYGVPAGMPNELFARAMEKVRSSTEADKEIRYRRVEQIAVWRLPH
ncbi:MAG: class I SAM-dependent methyltransferase, partial [Nitrososphaerales archaeon]